MAKLPEATHEGKITIGDIEIPCAVLSDGTRVISYSAVFKAFGRTKRGTQKNRVPNMPAFLNANNLQPFVGEDLRGVLNKIDYTTKKESVSSGFDASILPMLCKVYLDARSANKLARNQIALARASEILLLGLSKVGIISMVDEATGYQYEREKNELQKILKAYISSELLKWQKRFPDEFYREIFRLNNWDFTVSGIKKRPAVVGKWTNQLVYEQLPKGVLDELKRITPKSVRGNYKARFHQSLTMDIGHPDLHSQIYKIIGIMKIADTWPGFLRLFNKMKERENGVQELRFGDNL